MTERPVAPSHTLLARLLDDLELTGNISQDVPAFLHQHHHTATALHCQQVAAMAHRVAASASVSCVQAEIAGWLHDVSAIFPAKERVHIARTLGLEVLAEEDRCPMIVHQKLSRLMAQEIFGVTESTILDAIGCHTTLRPGPTTLDKVLFVADKLAWDQPSTPPYAYDLQVALAQSLDQAVLFFLTYLWERRDSLLVIHPWLRAAVHDLCGDDSRGGSSFLITLS